MDIHQHILPNRRKVIFLSLILPISLLVILGLAARPGSAESEEAFTTYLPNMSYYSFSGSHPMLASAGDDVGNPVPPEILSLTPVLTDPVIAVNQEVHFTAVITDIGVLDTHTAVWDWGDGSTTTQYEQVSPIEASHIYNLVGIYTVNLVVSNS